MAQISYETRLSQIRKVMTVLLLSFVVGVILSLITTRTEYTVGTISGGEEQVFIDDVPDRYGGYTRAVPYMGIPFTAVVGLHEDSMQKTETRVYGLIGNFIVSTLGVTVVYFGIRNVFAK